MTDTNGTGKPTDDADRPRINVEWDDTGALRIAIEGRITQDHLVMAAFYLTRTANGIVDELLRAAPTLVRAASVPADIARIPRKD